MNNCDMAVDFLPLPQEIKRSSGSWRAPDGALKLSIRGVSGTDLNRLTRIAEKIGAVKQSNSAADADLVLELDTALNLPSTVRPEVLDQAYLLEVGANRVLARARSPQGLYYALLTLQQMLRNAE
ncbi:MAG: glycoside hydrolase family 20 zincin-like fold domain-containing protein, partial [Kiritimatiellia bacterium]